MSTWIDRLCKRKLPAALTACKHRTVVRIVATDSNTHTSMERRVLALQKEVWSVHIWQQNVTTKNFVHLDTRRPLTPEPGDMELPYNNQIDLMSLWCGEVWLLTQSSAMQAAASVPSTHNTILFFDHIAYVRSVKTTTRTESVHS